MCSNKSQHQKEMPIEHQFLQGAPIINPYPKVPAANMGRNFLLIILKLLNLGHFVIKINDSEH